MNSIVPPPADRGYLPKRIRQPVTLATLDDLPEIPEHWHWKSLDQLILGPIHKWGCSGPSIRKRCPNPSHRRLPARSSRSRDKLQLVSATPEEQARYMLREGDLVINRVNSPSHLGKSLFVESRHVPAVLESNMMRVHLRAPTRTLGTSIYSSYQSQAGSC